jgi:cytoskeletal protein RodZ
MPSTPFGEQLKREREMRGVSIEEIASATRISTRFLQALEKEQWDQLPGGVFNRGFIRAVAQFLGLDPDSMVAEYELERKFTAPETPVVTAPPAEIPRNWRPAAAALALFAALVAGGWFAYERYALEISARLHSHADAFTAAPGEPIPQALTTAPDPNASGAPNSGAAASTGMTTSSGIPTSPNAPNSASPTSTTTAASAPLELKVQAGRAADVKVTADGAIVFNGHVDLNYVQTFTAHDSFEVTSTESSALFLELNGQTLPPLGKPGQPGSVTLTHKNLPTDAGGAH